MESGGPLPRKVTESASPEDTSPAKLLSALGELNNTVNKLVRRMEKQELHLESMEEKLDTTSLSSSSSECKAKTTRKVPVVVKVSTLEYAPKPNFQILRFNMSVLAR